MSFFTLVNRLAASLLDPSVTLLPTAALTSTRASRSFKNTTALASSTTIAKLLSKTSSVSLPAKPSPRKPLTSSKAY